MTCGIFVKVVNLRGKFPVAVVPRIILLVIIAGGRVVVYVLGRTVFFVAELQGVYEVQTLLQFSHGVLCLDV